MKKMKKFACMVLASVMAVSTLTACGDKAGQESAGGDTFKIGGIGPITGGTAVYGYAVKNGTQLAVDEINEAGGIAGKKIEYKFEDDENDPEKSVNAYNTLKDWGMQMLVGTTTSKPCTAVVAKTHEDNMFHLTPSATAVESIQYDNAFRICFSDPDQGKASAIFVGEHDLAKKVAVIYDNSDPYSAGVYKSFAMEAENQPFEIVTADAFTADSRTDFTVQLQKAKDSDADMVFLPIYYQEASLILTQADKMGYKPQFLGCDGLDGLLAVKNFDKALAEGAVLITPFTADAQDEETQNFVKKYREKFDDDPIQFAADAYDSVYALKAAVEKAGVTPDMSVSDICDKMKAAMLEITVDGLTGKGITWSAEGEPTKEIKAVVIENGKYKPM